VADYTYQKIVSTLLVASPQGRMVGGREGDNTSLGLMMFREMSERFVLINHDTVSHLE